MSTKIRLFNYIINIKICIFLKNNKAKILYKSILFINISILSNYPLFS
jgi:hypothetical protein